MPEDGYCDTALCTKKALVYYATVLYGKVYSIILKYLYCVLSCAILHSHGDKQSYIIQVIVLCPYCAPYKTTNYRRISKFKVSRIMFLIIFREFCHIVTDLLSMFPNGLVSTPLYSDTYISQCYWVKKRNVTEGPKG